MSGRPAGVFKHDINAQHAIGAEAYKAVPKSVFALVAFYFAQRVADDFSDEGARKAIADEIAILAENGYVSPAQAAAARKAFG